MVFEIIDMKLTINYNVISMDIVRVFYDRQLDNFHVKFIKHKKKDI